MSKTSKVILFVFSALVILLGVGYYSIMPSYPQNTDNKEKLITAEDLVKGTYIESFQVSMDPLRLKGKLSITDEEFSNIVYTLKEKYNIEELKDTFINVKDNKVYVIGPYKLFGFINTQYSTEIDPSIVDNDLVMKLSNLKIGKIKLSDSMLESVVKELGQEKVFTINGNVITVDKSFIKPITINNISIDGDKVILEVELQLNNMIDFIKENNIKVVA